MVKRAEGALLQSLALDRASPHPLSVQICSGLRELILGGTLKAGERLPATRTLAQELGVARTTIVDGFDRLAAEGLIEMQVGAGTFVSDVLGKERPVKPAREAPVVAASAKIANAMDAASRLFGTRLAHAPRPFTTAMPAFDAFPMAQWARLSAKHWRMARHDVLGYPSPHGYRPLREAIAAHLRLNRGIACDWSEIFVVAGAQQAFQLVASMLLDPGDKVWFENPGAIGARNCFVLHGADLVPVPVDDDGMDVDKGLKAASSFKLAFVTPSHQQPLGAKMSLERRFTLLKAAQDCGGWVIEDDWDGEFCFSGLPLPALKGVDRSGRVIYVGTFSKSLFPSLRLGFVLAPPGLAEQFRISLDAFSPGVPTALQAIVADFIAEGHFATHIRRTRKLYSERYDALLDAVRKHLCDDLDIVPTTTGLHTVAFLKRGLRAADVVAAAARHGLTIESVARFCVVPISREGIVLGFSGYSPAQIQAGALKLKRAVDELSSTRQRA